MGAAGRYNAAGVPNITGRLEAIRFQGDASIGDSFWSGSIETDISYKNLNVEQGGLYGTTGYNFNAAKSSYVYGGSDTVMPSSVDMVIGIYLGTTA